MTAASSSELQPLIGLLTDVSIAWPALTGSQVLAAVAALLLLFVSGGVVYLSTVEWRDRRRRSRAGKGGRGLRQS